MKRSTVQCPKCGKSYVIDKGEIKLCPNCCVCCISK